MGARPGSRMSTVRRSPPAPPESNLRGTGGLLGSTALPAVLAPGGGGPGLDRGALEAADAIRPSPNVRILDNADRARFDGEPYDCRAADGGRRFRAYRPGTESSARGWNGFCGGAARSRKTRGTGPFGSGPQTPPAGGSGWPSPVPKPGQPFGPGTANATWAVELFSPWSEGGRHGGLLGEPASGARSAFRLSYRDVDRVGSRTEPGGFGGRSP